MNIQIIKNSCPITNKEHDTVYVNCGGSFHHSACKDTVCLSCDNSGGQSMPVIDLGLKQKPVRKSYDFPVRRDLMSKEHRDFYDKAKAIKDGDGDFSVLRKGGTLYNAGMAIFRTLILKS